MKCRAPLLFLFILFLSLLIAPRVFAAPPKPVSVQAYRAQLEKAERQLAAIEARAPRRLAPILTPLSSDKIVKRADGQTQTASGDEFSRTLKTTPNATRAQTRRVRESISARRKSLDEWAQNSYAPADAQAIVRQLEGSGQVRTRPTWLEQSWSDGRKWVSQTFLNFVKWIGSLFPSATPGKLPTIDPNWIRAIFFITVLALLAAIAYLVWRAVGGKIGRRRNKQGAFAFSPEDAELLLLPPDELRERAKRFASEGNFREALRHLYIALLLSLDARGVWRYDARRTNWEHIAALQSDAARSTLVAPLSDITRRFDRVRYGNAACAQNDWTQFESDVDALERQSAG